MKRLLISVFAVIFILGGFVTARADTSKEQREEYQKQSESKLKGFDERVKEMQSKAAELKGDVKKEFNEEMVELKKKQKAAKAEWVKLKAATSKSWNKVKERVDSATEELDKLYEKMMAHFKRE